MNDNILRSVEKGTLMIKEGKKRNEEIYVRIRLESGQIVKVNKGIEGNRKYLKEDEIVILELSHILDIRLSNDESLFRKTLESNSKLLKSEDKTKLEKYMGFRFTIHYGLVFNLKTIAFRAPNTAQYFDWITGLKYLMEKIVQAPYSYSVESWLWKHYYEIGESVTDGKTKGPVEIDDEFLIPMSFNKPVSCSMNSLGDSTESLKLESFNKWQDELISMNKFNSEKSAFKTINTCLSPYQMIHDNPISPSVNNFYHFRRYSCCSNVSPNGDSSLHIRFISPDLDGCKRSLKSLNVKISPKQLAVWLAQQNGSKIPLDNIKEYNSNYPPKPNFIDFSGFVKIYRELLYQPEKFIAFIQQRLKKVQNSQINTINETVKLDSLSLNPLDMEWLQTIRSYSLNYNFQEMDLDALFSASNSIWDPKRAELVYHDMDQPLSAYYISTSHNSYLTGDQITSKSSCEAYTRCIQMGCRSVELDCWNGDREPIIYHGNTLTSKIKLSDVLQTIKKSAWQKSNYPLILSLEDHCDIQQQIIIAQMMQETFQEELLTNPIKMDDASLNELPSPNQLKNKIILKHKKLPIDNLKKSNSANGLSEPIDDLKENILSSYLYSGRMCMKDLFLDSWTPYYFLLSQNRTLVYTEDTGVSDCDQNCNQIILRKPSMQPESSDPNFQKIDNSARFITIDHSEKLAINCNGCIPSELTSKTKLPNWFHGLISRVEANYWLLRYWFLGDGTFLIRTSESFQGNYSLSFYRKDKVYHVRICKFFDKINNVTSLGFEHCDIQFLTMEDLVAHYQENDMVALDFNVRLKNPPPERFQDKSWFYENPPINIVAAEELLNKVPLVGSFLVSCEKTEHSINNLNIKVSPKMCKTLTDDIFILSYRSRGNITVHSTIVYDGFQYSISGYSSNSLVELINYFHKNRLSDGVKLKYPVDSNLIKKCLTLSKVSPNYPYIRENEIILDYKVCKLNNNEHDKGICSSVTSNDLLSLHQNDDDELFCVDSDFVHNDSQIVKVTESIKRLKFRDTENGDISNIGSLGNMEMGNFQLDSDCYVKLRTIDSNNDNTLFMFPFDLYIADFKIQLACETEQQRSSWIDAITICLDDNSDKNIHLCNRKNEIQHRIAKSLSDLIVYCNSVPFNWPDSPEDLAQLLSSSCKDMSSISENRFLKLLSTKSSNTSSVSNSNTSLKINGNSRNNDMSMSKLTDLIEYHKYHLTRVYPKPTRLDSSNLSPIIPWLSGVQMAAINFQTPDRSLQLNQALFKDNGGCGYVSKNAEVFTPSQHLEIKLTFLGARHLPRINKGLLEIEIISLYDEMCDKRTFPLKSEFQVTNINIPDIKFLVKNPNMAFIRFAYGSDEKLGQKKRMNSCQATFLVRGIRPGIRSINFRNGFDFLHDLAAVLFHVNLTIIEEGK